MATKKSIAKGRSKAQWFSILRQAAEAGASAIRGNYSLEKRTSVVGRGIGGDLTLEIDKVSERAIYKFLAKKAGKDSFVFVSEEMGEFAPRNEASDLPIIVCDPLDGSHNAEVGIPLFAVSLSLIGVERWNNPSSGRLFGQVDIGVVRSVLTDDEYSAMKGSGAFHNGKRIKGTQGAKSNGKLHTVGVECGDIDFAKKLVSEFRSEDIYKLRLIGSAALSYSYLAVGTYSAFIFAQPGGARSIDSPAGYIICKESGRHLTAISSDKADIDKQEVGFQSRLNIIGAHDKETLGRIARLLPSELQ